MLFARNAQEAGDLCLIARRAAETSKTPFFNVQDGFLTTHTVETVRLPEPESFVEVFREARRAFVSRYCKQSECAVPRAFRLTASRRRRRPWQTQSPSACR